MNKTVKTAIDNISSVVTVMTDNITSYTNKALAEVKNMKSETESEIKPVMGYETGDQGWYDQIGGGPCNKYCRYTGISPNIKWTCSDENDLSKLIPTPKDKTGNFCYGYDRKTKKPVKTGVVVKGQFINTTKPETNIEDSGNYNFVIYNNKKAQNIDNFENIENISTPNSNEIENFENVTTSCYGAPGASTCNTCNDVVNAYQNAGWAYDTNNFDQCKIPSETTSCYGASTPTCNTCNDVVNAYKKDNWAFNTNNFAQCDAKPAPPVDKNPPSTDPRWEGPQLGTDYPYNDLQSFQINQISDCGNACYNNNKCMGFVTNDAANYCWLKGAFANQTSNGDRNAYTINRNLPSTDSRWTGPEQIDYPGNDIQSFAINQVSDCGEACVNNPDCVGFVTNDAANTCWLKNKFGNPNKISNRNAYKVQSHYEIVNNVSLKECENICQNDDTCKGFNYDTAKKTCAVSQETIKPTNFDTNSISGNKKVHTPLNGTFNIYQNNSCVNSTLFNKDANVYASLGITTNDNNIPIIPKKPVCANQLNNNFIFGKNYEIMALDTDTLEKDYDQQSWSFWSGTTDDFYSTYQQVNDARCLQVNTDGSITKENCTYNDNQKWTYDDNIKSIRTWDGNCLNVNTNGQNVDVSVKPCVDDINQKFYLKPVVENLQPKNYNVLDGFKNINDDKNSNVENFETNTNINNYLSKNRNSQDYLYKLPYSSPYVKNINSEENFEANECMVVNSYYYIYLIIIVLLLIIMCNK